MNTKKLKSDEGSKTKSKNSKTAQMSEGKTQSKMQSSQLMQLFEDELKDIYWAEKALTKAIPKMIENATSEELIKTLTNHLAETEEQVKRVEKVFKVLGKNPVAAKCQAMAGLMKEAEEIMAACEKGSMRDAGIISAAQKVEHYEIASYGILRQFAETMQLNEAAELLDKTLQEEKQADLKLSDVAMDAINVEAAEEMA